MSIKSIVLFTSLFVILSSQSNIVRAAIDDEVEAAESMRSMKTLFDLNQNKIPLSEFAAESPMPKLLLKDNILMTQEALDKQMISGLKGTSVLLPGLENEIVNSQFAKRVQFSPNDIKKQESWLQILEGKLEKFASYFPSEYYGPYGYGMPD